MEDKSFNWFLSECCSRKLRLNILETGICRGSLLLDWFHTDQFGQISRKVKKDSTRTKHLLSYFLNQRHPVLEEYNPDKVICYLYHKTGIKVVSSKESIELIENQLHGLQVTSLHMTLSNSLNYYKAYRLQAWSEGGELCHKLTYGRIAKDMNEEVTDAVIYEKVLSVIIYLSDILAKSQLKNISKIKIDLVTDAANSIYIVKVLELGLDDTFMKSEAIIRNLVRRPSFKQYEESSEEDISGGEFEGLQSGMKVIQEYKKKNTDYKMPLKKNKAPNSKVFLEMIAKTFDRDRKVQEYHEKIKNKKLLLENCSEHNNRKIFQLKSLKYPRENIPKKHAISSVNELLYYVEKTRPRIWLCDVEEKGCDVPDVQTCKHQYNKSSESNAKEKVKTPKGYDGQLFGILSKMGQTQRSKGFYSNGGLQTPINQPSTTKSKPCSPRNRIRQLRPSNKSLRILPLYANLH